MENNDEHGEHLLGKIPDEATSISDMLAGIEFDPQLRSFVQQMQSISKAINEHPALPMAMRIGSQLAELNRSLECGEFQSQIQKIAHDAQRAGQLYNATFSEIGKQLQEIGSFAGAIGSSLRPVAELGDQGFSARIRELLGELEDARVPTQTQAAVQEVKDPVWEPFVELVSGLSNQELVYLCKWVIKIVMLYLAIISLLANADLRTQQRKLLKNDDQAAQERTEMREQLDTLLGSRELGGDSVDAMGDSLAAFSTMHSVIIDELSCRIAEKDPPSEAD